MDQTFQDFLVNESVKVEVGGFLINLLITAVLAFILSRIYIRYGNSLSNRRLFAKNFILMAMTTMLIITVVKSSLALSLGLVGALSIVRFRAAIKEPEELSYLFLTIALGLGLGADQKVITIAAFFLISVVIVLKNYKSSYDENKNLHLTVSCGDAAAVDLEKIVTALKKFCPAVNLKRYDESPELLEASFLVEYDDFSQLNKSKNELLKLHDSVRITFLDNKGVQ